MREITQSYGEKNVLIGHHYINRKLKITCMIISFYHKALTARSVLVFLFLFLKFVHIFLLLDAVST